MWATQVHEGVGGRSTKPRDTLPGPRCPAATSSSPGVQSRSVGSPGSASLRTLDSDAAARLRAAHNNLGDFTPLTVSMMSSGGLQRCPDRLKAAAPLLLLLLVSAGVDEVH
ncbi:unnamed protein product [Pleuronectes platessa]|uniref:Uncharacterized protein n=1 Tax=Pleuronectes platessa TaxID=8262 RepID=A0A9N7YSJ8_PLEPL|nr:unnamed protein product [Pleuronectes platessa]